MIPLLASGGRPAEFALPGVEGALGVWLKALLPFGGFLVAAPLLWLLFRGTWQQLDVEAASERQAAHSRGDIDRRPGVMFALVALMLTTQWYYGGGQFYRHHVRPWLRSIESAQRAEPGGLGQYVDVLFYGELYSYGWWAFTRVVGYTIVPLAAYKLIFRRDSLLDMGLRTKGLLKHAWIYGLFLAVVVPCVFLVARSPEFASYYPFYKQCSRSWFDLICWEAMYIAQFFALEVFFRGFMLSPLRRSMGSAAIFAMCVPYVMIHFGKPYLESSGAFIAGIALGSLAMRTRSIYSGFMVHVTVALLMDGLAIAYGGGLPTTFWPR